MLELFKKGFGIFKRNTILTLPFIIFLFIISVTLNAMWQTSTKSIFIGFIVANFLVISVFLSGWFYLIKKSIENSKISFVNKSEEELASLRILKEFIPGVGEYFLSTSIMSIIFISLLFGLMFIVYQINLKLFGDLQVSMSQFKAASISTIQMNNYISNLTKGQFINLVSWFGMISFSYFLYCFFTVFLYPALYFSANNPIKAVILNFRFIYKNFLLSFGIFFLLNILNSFISLFNTIFANNLILGTIGLLLFAYFAVYCGILIFLAYDEKK